MNSGADAVPARKGIGVNKLCIKSIPETMALRLACTCVDCILKSEKRGQFLECLVKRRGGAVGHRRAPPWNSRRDLQWRGIGTWHPKL